MVQEQIIYQAIGVVEGILRIGDGADRVLLVSDLEFPVVRVAKRSLPKHREGEVQRFTVYPQLRNNQLHFQVEKISSGSFSLEPGEFRLKGCWEQYKGENRLVVYRNFSELDMGRKIVANCSVLALTWQNAPPADGQFWELRAKLESDRLVVVGVEGLSDPPPAALPTKSRKQLSNVEHQKTKTKKLELAATAK